MKFLGEREFISFTKIAKNSYFKKKIQSEPKFFWKGEVYFEGGLFRYLQYLMVIKIKLKIYLVLFEF